MRTSRNDLRRRVEGALHRGADGIGAGRSRWTLSAPGTHGSHGRNSAVAGARFPSGVSVDKSSQSFTSFWRSPCAGRR